ncbi:MAG TPA: hypothetical protein DF296_08490 [Candidatus Margulisbacteria bacterium]|nr:MAG: hypothetical protein A2X43_08160 [Candidatus Margulisbacteria bacterium GWD2_39_127]OGI01651.1 MAG: hypothetical protein A2X42_04825 [Candidatus Margulisbacteria bacterium GWF2_38_17]OGI06909.1 MAG: hypothetical protein A2X41_10530 [Candidatus Margulisbacteria bacterium GWE2_39_32]HAR63615.1 hypothetical protein [Candidatus Margulisiibacteriota bacterium]HCT85224.1 hypothetical protein [Candidatus Margulisiibacteriota bacterium]
MTINKALISFLIVCILTTGFLTTKIFVPVANAWETVVVCAGLVLLDNHIKYVAKKNKSKNGTTTKYVPAPGYGDNDKYWKLDDLVSHYKENTSKYSFLNNAPPSDAVASLPSSALTNDGVAIASIKPSNVASNAIAIPWNTLKPSLKKGDVVLMRSNSSVSQVLRYLTSWVHTALIYDLAMNQTYEANPGQVAKLCSPLKDWSPSYSWSVKRVKDNLLSASQVTTAVENAYTKYSGKPYFPSLIGTWTMRGEFISKWANKNDTTSFYCSKLVWRTFYDAGVNLDSERTTAMVDSNFMKNRTDYGAENAYAWIGVSGDDIYYSKNLNRDIYTYGLENLNKPLPIYVAVPIY